MVPETTSSRRLTKVLVKVTVDRSFGAAQVVVSTDQETVKDLVKAVLKIYAAEKRRPLLPETNPHRFELHYSCFSFESLNEDEKVINLGSRDFFLCKKPVDDNMITNTVNVNTSFSEEVKKKATNSSSFPWTQFMDFLL
ncbi:hypothetical protein L484_023205 [Morus notabilis]|uniref:DUF7054 domain-containing protein n=1 Tax=Morus notabilis TaxID=981085 RepID=W9SN25_9ROSA|nr:uncharacterized protein At4g22758 [Morus notabilis]EXC17849.1 hypothetical protein L484_023205 [Morus notabilis]